MEELEKERLIDLLKMYRDNYESQKRSHIVEKAVLKWRDAKMDLLAFGCGVVVGAFIVLLLQVVLV